MPLLNTFYSSMALLLHGDGANNSTVFTDSGPAALTMSTVGTPAIVTGASVFGGSSMYFNGASRVLSPASLASLAFGTGNFRIGFWMRPASLATARAVFSVSSSVTLRLVINTNGSLTMQGGAGSGGTSATGLIAANTWYYIELGRLSNGFIYVYVNGGNVVAANLGTGYSYTAGQLNLGYSAAENTHFLGHIDEFFIAPGQNPVAGFVPADAWMDRLPQISGTVLNAAGAPAARLITAYQDSTNPLGNNKVGTATSDATTGAYALGVTTDQPCTVVAQPAAGEALNALVLRGVQPA